MSLPWLVPHVHARCFAVDPKAIGSHTIPDNYDLHHRPQYHVVLSKFLKRMHRLYVLNIALPTQQYKVVPTPAWEKRKLTLFMNL